ncbi:MAG: inorganic diphosphatase [Patescibacteria group bacterium]
MTTSFDFLGHLIDITVDRPIGSKHPTHGFAYPVNYGFVPGTQSPDGEELDAYLLSVDRPLKNFRGRCVAVIHRTNDNDDKLIVVPDGTTITDDQIRQATYFQEQYFQSEIIRSQ